jgi:hypothetical protein
MIDKKEIEKLFKLDLDNVLNDIIWKNKTGDYEVFNRYKIVKGNPTCIVLRQGVEIGVFSGTKTALSWCIADKYKNHRLAQDILSMDSKLSSLIADIKTRANLADRSKDAKFQEIVETKLETKIIHKKQLETQLDKCVDWAKYCQQRGINNEIVRTSNSQSIKTSRQGI